MDTAPQESPKPDMNPESQVPPIDPEAEIDAKRTTVWLVAAFLFVVVSLMVLFSVYHFSVAGEKMIKIDQVPAEELRQLRSNEDAWLKKTEPLGTQDHRSLAEIEREITETTSGIIRRYAQK